MKTIFKYQPKFDDRLKIQTHERAELLSVQYQQDVLTFWFLVDTNRPVVPHTYVVYGTGHEIDLPLEDMIHVASVQELDDRLVWHIFELFVPADKPREILPQIFPINLHQK